MSPGWSSIRQDHFQPPATKVRNRIGNMGSSLQPLLIAYGSASCKVSDHKL